MCDALKSMSLTTVPGENVQEFSLAVLKQVTAIRQSVNDMAAIPDLAQLSLAGFIHCTDESIRMTAKRLLNEADKFNVLTPEVAMTELCQDYVRSTGRDAYGPALQRKKASNSGYKAMQAELKVLSSELKQQRANTGGGSGGTPNTEGPRPCFNCGQEGHRIQECPAPPAPIPSSRERPHALDAATSTQVSALITAYQAKMPSFSSIKMTDYHCIKLNNAIMAEYCHKCRRFNKKGPNMHHTATHVKRKGRGGTAPAPAPAPAAAPAPAPAPVPDGSPFAGLADLQLWGANYSLFCAAAPSASSDGSFHDSYAYEPEGSFDYEGDSFHEAPAAAPPTGQPDEVWYRGQYQGRRSEMGATYHSDAESSDDDDDASLLAWLSQPYPQVKGTGGQGS